MTSQQRADKRKNNYILAMYDDGCTIAEITKQVTQSLLHINNVIDRYRNLK
jgi:Mor family transcriptional regulator